MVWCCNRCLYPHYNSLVMLVLLYDIILLLMKIKKLTRVKKKFIYLDSEIFLYNNQSMRISVLFLFHFFVLKLLTIFLLLQCTSKHRENKS